MKTCTDYQQWTYGEDEFWKMLGVAGFAILFALSVALNNVWAGIIGGLAVITLIYLAYKPFSRAAVYKFFLTTWPVAMQIVEDVLQAKGVPYKRIGENFTVDDITIRVKTGIYGKNGPKGIYIQIGPYQGKNVPLIQSLREKLDAAFAPRGLKSEYYESPIFNL